MRARIATIGIVGAVCAALTGCGAAHSFVGIHEPPSSTSAAAAMTEDQARSIVDRVFTAAGQAQNPGSASASSARSVAFSGAALTAAVADARLASVKPSVSADSPAISPQRPRLLTVSRGPGFPRVIVVQTVPAQGSLPVLHLLTSPDPRTPFRIAESATMLPGSEVQPFNALRAGSPLVNDGKGLAVVPQSLLEAYAKGLGFPAKTAPNPPYQADAFATQVRAAAAAQASGVSKVATYTQQHAVQPGSVYAVSQAGGGALVFGVIQRTDTFTVKEAGSTLNAPKQFATLLPRKNKLTSKATMTTLELVVFAVPKGSGQAKLVAASEHLVSAAGS
jgi:hypothetical protein